MALTSSRLPFLPRVREGRYLRRYRQYLLEENVLTRSAPLLPHLERLPLLVQPIAGGEAVSLAEALKNSPKIRLVSAASTMRDLISRQLCLHWAQGKQISQAFPLLYRLAAVQSSNITPLHLLQREFQTRGFDHDELTIKRGLAAGLWLFLLEGWDELAPDQQSAWATWLQTCADRYPALAAVVVTGPMEQSWPAFEDWVVVPLTK